MFVQVVPTDYERKRRKTQSTFQYAATEHYRHISTLSSNGMPGVYFYYEVCLSCMLCMHVVLAVAQEVTIAAQPLTCKKVGQAGKSYF